MALRLNGKQIQVGRVVGTGKRYQRGEWDPLPASTSTSITIGRSPQSLFLDELDQQIEIAKHQGVNADQIKQIVRDLNDLQAKVGYSSEPILSLKNWCCPCVCLGMILIFPLCIYASMGSKAVEKYMELRRKLREEAIKYAQANNDRFSSSYGFILIIPEKFPEDIQIQFVQQNAMGNINHNNIMMVNISLRTKQQIILTKNTA